jgi:hypothetical protein
LKRYRLKLAIISGCHCYTIKKFLSMTRRFAIDGYEKIYY